MHIPPSRPTATSLPVPGRRRRRTVAALGTTVVWTVFSGALAAAAWGSGNGAGSTTDVQGSQSAGHWPLIQTLGIFLGIPVAAALIIVGLVMLGPAIRSGRESIDAVAFSGPHAGAVDPAPASTGDVDAGGPAQGGAGARW